ncbi:MAG: N-(5-phosphoribosyl)anthranilate isomerase [Acidobacteriota bacterium]
MIEVHLKVCGITSLADALVAVECGATYLGFNFYRPSPRFIEPEAARVITSALPAAVCSVGIFVNEPRPDDVRRIIDQSGVALAQLHGEESVAYCLEVGAERVIKAFRAGGDFHSIAVMEYPVRAILLDAYDPRLHGGTGRTADWNIAADLARRVDLFLAGGLNPENVVDAIEAVRPFAVDLNSGVESAPGIKDAAKLRRLAERLGLIKSV